MARVASRFGLGSIVTAGIAQWTWFPERTNPLIQFLAHAFFFGAPIGWMLGRSRVVIGPTV